MKRTKHFCLIVLASALLASCATYHPRPISPATTATAFNARSLDDPGLLAFLQTNGVAAPARSDAWDLKTLTLTAFFYEPSLAEARAQLLAARAAEITAGQRPNPSLSVTPGYDSQIPGAPSPWIVPVSMDWPIETDGKRGDRVARARALSEAARWDLIAAVWRVRGQVRAALLNVFAARETAALLEAGETAQSNVVRLLTGQFEAGNVSSYEVTQAQIGLDTTRLARQAAIGQYQQARVQLASAIGLPLRALAGAKFSMAPFNRFPRQLTRPDVRRRALLARADVRAALAQYAASQAALKLEIANQYPDIHLGPGYSWNSGSAGDNEWDLGLTLTLPILNQNQGAIADARARRAVAAAHFLAVQAAAIGQIDSALAGYRAALEQVTTATALLANLRKQLDSIKAQALAGEAGPLEVANARVAFDSGSRDQLNALIQAQQALGLLEDAMQSPLTLKPAALRAAQTHFSKISMNP